LSFILFRPITNFIYQQTITFTTSEADNDLLFTNRHTERAIGAMSVPVCGISEELREELKAFRFSRAKNSRAIVMKIDPESRIINLEEKLEDVDAEALKEALPERQPRFAVYSFKLEHGEGRVSYPMCLLFSTPRGCKTELQVMYAGTKLSLVDVAGLTKVFEIRDLDDLSDEWLRERLVK